MNNIKLFFADAKRTQWTLVALLGSVFLFRVSDTVLHPQFWAEDGSIFFQDAYCVGGASIIKPYNGYYHLIPRLTALFANQFDPLYAPAIYCGVAVILTFLVLYLALSPRLSLPFKPLLALLIVIIPNGDEVYANITNTQWYLAIGVLLVIIMKPSNTKFHLFLETLFVFVAGLTGPFVLLLMPVFIAKVWLNRSLPEERQRSTALMIAAFATSVLQAYALSISNIPTPGDISELPHDFSGNLSLLSVVLFMHLFFPFIYIIDHFYHALFIDMAFTPLVTISSITLILAVSVFIYSLVRGDYKFEKIAIAYFGAIVLAASLYKIRGMMLDLLQDKAANRYFFIPSIMLCWLLVLLLKDKLLRYVSMILIVFLISSAAVDFRRKPFDNLNWPLWANKIGSVPQLTIPINPTGFYIDTGCISHNH